MERRLALHLSACPPWLPWAQLPTPVTPWGEDRPWLWVKRDDQSHARYGGGKVRKLEWLLADPHWAQGPVLSVGAIGSHHLRALAELLDLQGRRLHALVFPQVATPHATANFRRLLELETQVFPMASRLALPWAWARYQLGSTRPKARYLAAGASAGVGLLGFVEAGLELAEQVERQELPRPARIYMAAGTAGSVAGLSVGLALAKVQTRIVAVSSVERLAFNALMLERQRRACWRELSRWGLAPRQAERAVPVTITHDQLGRGYGVPTRAGQRAMDSAAAVGLKLEPTYTAKVLAQVLTREGPGAEPVLLWNTHASNPQWRGPADPQAPWPASLANWAKGWPLPDKGATPESSQRSRARDCRPSYPCGSSWPHRPAGHFA